MAFQRADIRLIVVQIDTLHDFILFRLPQPFSHFVSFSFIFVCLRIGASNWNDVFSPSKPSFFSNLIINSQFIGKSKLTAPLNYDSSIAQLHIMHNWFEAFTIPIRVGIIWVQKNSALIMILAYWIQMMFHLCIESAVSSCDRFSQSFE